VTSGSREHEAELSTPTGTLGASDSGIVLDRDGTPNKIGRFLVLQRLGSGGMGLVYSAFDEQLDRKVAIKLLRPHVAHSGRATLGQARLLREAQAMARLAHPNVVTVHEVGTFGDQVFIAMEFLSGVTLKSWLRRTTRRWQEVVDVFVQAGRGLAVAHAAGLIHRDFKPDNVMVLEDPGTGKVIRVCVFDFGVVQEVREAALRQGGETIDTGGARRTPNPDPEDRRRSSDRRTPGATGPIDRARARGLPSQSSPGLRFANEDSPLPSQLPEPSHDSLSEPPSGLTAAGALVGTPMYMAPEQYQQTADARSDQFSFCAALFEGLYRKRPFSGDSAAALQRAKLAGRLRARPDGSDVPGWLHLLVLRGLSSDPNQRFPDMEALLRELVRDRLAWRRYAVVGLAFVAALLVGAFGTRAFVERDPCLRVADAIAEAWSPERRAAIEQAFLASGRSYAASTFASVEAALSRHAGAWADQRRELCAQTRADPSAPQLVSRGLCLDLRLQEFSALTDLLARADADVVDHAPTAVGQLTPVGACDDVVALLARAPPPPPPRLSAVATAFADRLAEVRVLEQTGKYAAGLVSARDAVAEARRLDHDPWFAEALLLEGSLHAHLRSLRAAEDALFEASVVAEASRHDEVLARAWTELVRVVGVEQERYDEGERWGKLADAAVRRIGGGPEAVALAGHLGRLHEHRGDLSTAQADYERAAKLAEETLPERHPLRATARIDLGGYLLARGRYAEAATAYGEALALRRAVFGNDHPRVAEALSLLARVAWERKNLDQAHALASEALRICEGPGRCSPAERGQALVDLARIEFTRGRYLEGQRLTERALELYESIYGSEHTRVASLQMNLGVFAKNLGRHDEARARYQRALQIQRLHHPEDHPDLEPLHINLGTLAMDQDRWTDAREHFRVALEIHRKSGDDETYGLANLLDNDGVSALRLGDHAAAIDRHTRALAIYTRDHGDTHPDVVRVRTHLAQADLAAGRHETAAQLAEQQLDALARAGADAPEVPQLRLVLAETLVLGHDGPAPKDRLSRARDLARAALARLRADPARAAEAAAAATFLASLPAERP
jgi:serine/threonine protein kinase/tetratricopeptide (TPR) repeat protein